MFFYQEAENQTLVNKGERPVITETERMVYVAFSEYFFDSAMFSYFQAGVLTMEFQGDQVRGQCADWVALVSHVRCHAWPWGPVC